MFNWKPLSRIFVTAKSCGRVEIEQDDGWDEWIDRPEVILVSVKKQGMLHPAGSAVVAISEFDRREGWQMHYLVKSDIHFRASLAAYMRGSDSDVRHNVKRVAGCISRVHIFAPSEKEAARFAREKLGLGVDEQDADHWVELAHQQRAVAETRICNPYRTR